MDRQTDRQAGTPVAEIVGGRRSDDNACSGSSRVIRFRGRRGGGGGGGPRSLLSYIHSKQFRELSCRKPRPSSERPLLQSTGHSSSSGLRPVCTRLATHFTYSPRVEPGAVSRSVRARRHIKCLQARWKDDQPLHDLACATDTCSQHRRGQTIQGTRRPTRDGNCPNDSRGLVPPRACDRALSSKQSDSVGVARTRPSCRSEDRAIVICDHRIQAHLLPDILL